MNKSDLLKELSEKLSAGDITREEVMRALKLPATHKGKHEEKGFSVARMLYVLGISIVVLGIVFFVSQIWTDIGAVGRIVVTLGLGFLFTVLGSMLLKQKPDETIGSVFHFIGGMLIPGGAMVTLSELSTDTPTLWPVAITFAVIYLFYMLLNTAHKSPVLSFFAIANGTVFIYVLVEAIVDGYSYEHEELFGYLTMVVGISYLLLSHAFRGSWNEPLRGLLNFFGITGLLGAAFMRIFDGNARVLDGNTWELLFFLLVMAGLYLAVYARSRVILVMSTVFLIVHVSYITSEYFADSIGWPLALVLLGFVFIGLGYASIAINKRYITKS